MDEMQTIAVKYNTLAEDKKKIDSEMQALRKQLLEYMEKNGRDKLVFGDIVVLKEVRQLFTIGKELREKYGEPKNVTYLFVMANDKK